MKKVAPGEPTYLYGNWNQPANSLEYKKPGSDLTEPGCRFVSEQSLAEQDHFSRQHLLACPEPVEVYA
jgi:hypothetical protein